MLATFNGIDLILTRLRFKLFFVFVLNMRFKIFQKMGIFLPCLFFGVEKVNVSLNHLELSYVYLLSLLYYFSDMFPLKLLLIIFKDMLHLNWEQSVSPFDDMRPDVVIFDQLQNCCLTYHLQWRSSFLAKS